MLYGKIAFCGLVLIGMVCSGIPALSAFSRFPALAPAAARADMPTHNNKKQETRLPPVQARTGPAGILLDREYYTSLMQDLAQARHSILIIMYLFKPSAYASALPDRIIDLLARKRAQGVDVSVLLNVDRDHPGRKTVDTLNETNLHTARLLEANGIPVYLDSPRRTTHTKAVVIDTRIVYIGSHNFTHSALRYNHEASIRIVSPAAARALTDYMEAIKHEQ